MGERESTGGEFAVPVGEMFSGTRVRTRERNIFGSLQLAVDCIPHIQVLAYSYVQNRRRSGNFRLCAFAYIT